MSMFDELETVALKKAVSKYGLKKGDVGSIVHIYHGNKLAEVEFVAASGKTTVVLTLSYDDIRPV
jgi:Domain of unknown function (DUF4926)